MKEQLIDKLKLYVAYVETIEELQSFWKSNISDIELITAYYFSFSKPLEYQKNKLYFVNKIKEIIEESSSQIEEKLKQLIEEFQNAEYSDKYIELLNRQLNFISNYRTDYSQLKSLNAFNASIDLQKLKNNEHINLINKNIYNDFSGVINVVVQNLQALSQLLSGIEFYDLLKKRDENLILIGPNGSGKSTFSRQIKKNITQKYNSSVAVIPAQKTFGVRHNSSIPLKKQAYTEFTQSHTDDKLYKDVNNMHFANSEFEHMVNYLIAEHQEVANETHTNYDIIDFKKENSILENVIAIWEDIITHLKLEYDGQGNIQVKPENVKNYDFMGLSDGEKSIFYCIASVLTVAKDGYIIVDEPENHLNMSIVNKLWDILENIRSDCQFVYLTHNPSFATGRGQTKILWVKKYIPPSNWDYIEIPTSNTLPQELMVELVGSKKNILFCEGQKDSYDYQLYSILFKNYTIIPVGGHQKVIDYCKAYNQNNQLFECQAIGIIDKDFYDSDEVSAWQKDKIFVLDVMEVENILCDDEVLKVIKLNTHASEENYKDAKEQIFSHIQRTKDKQAMEYTRFKTDKTLNSLVGKSNSATDLKKELEKEIVTLEPQSFYDNHIKLLNLICKGKDYNQALKHYNNKGMISFVGDKILKDYKNRVINFIRDDSDLQKKLLDKYFCRVPSQ